jgi:vacuolar-type H+-ATPase subunit I/STV1
MTPAQMNTLNGLVLLVLGTWGAVEAVMFKAAGGESFSPTVFIAPVFGVLFLIMSPFFGKGNKAIVHIVVALTPLLVLSMFKPLLAREGVAQIRVALMMLSGLIATVIYIKSFVDARRNRA